MKGIKYYFYVLRCCDQTYYGGFTTNLTKRLATHNAKKGAKYTRARVPVHVIYYETYETKSQALKREAWFKKKTRKQKQRFLKEHHGLAPYFNKNS
ncbi:GIY-YIG nuclease family protein [Holzapfeliella sp. JNUCC 80]